MEEAQSRVDGAGICAEELRAEPFSLGGGWTHKKKLS